MDINLHNKLTNNNTSWGIDMSNMEDHHILQNQLPFDSIWPLQTSSSSSSQQVFGDYQIENQIGGGGGGEEDHNLHQHDHHQEEQDDEDHQELGAMKEMMYKIAAMQPVDIDPSTIRKPKRRNVRISEDPQSVAARHRRERISEKIRILQRLVPGGTKMDTASMLDEAIRYVKFLKRQIRLLQSNHHHHHHHHHHHPPCLGITTTTGNLLTVQDWQPPPPPITSSSNEPPTSLFVIGDTSRDTLCFNHEVISD